jgi:hypothetical protein
MEMNTPYSAAKAIQILLPGNLRADLAGCRMDEKLTRGTKQVNRP